MIEEQGGQSLPPDQLLDLIVPTEREGRNHTSSSIEPRLDGDKGLRHLDCLAKLTTFLGEKCVAVCERGGELLVASNSESPEYAPTYISKLQPYLNRPSEKTYEQLELEAKKQIGEKIIKDSFDIFIEKYSFLMGANQKFYESIEMHYESRTSESLNQLIGECSTILSLPKETVDPKMYQTASNIVRPLIDTQVLINEIDKDQNRGLKQSILEGKVYYVEGEEGKHAEVKISEHLYDNKGQMLDGSKYYIGITKLTCGPCDMALETFAEATGKNIKLSYAGTHGGTYPGWQMPKWITPDNPSHNIFVGKLNQILASDDKWEKAPEATPILKEDVDLFLESLTRKVSPVKGEEVAKGTGASGSTVIQTKEARDTTLEVVAGGGGSSTSSTHAETLGKRQRSPEKPAHAQTEHEGASEASRIMQFLIKEQDKSPRSSPARPSDRRDSPSRRGSQAGGSRGRG